MKRWEKLWEDYSSPNESSPIGSPYRRGAIKPSKDLGENIANLRKLVETGTQFVDIDPPKTKAEVDDVLTDLMAIFDDMFEVLGSMGE